MTQETQVQSLNTPYDTATTLMAAIPGVNQVTSFFQGNPMATPLGQMIERATDATLPSENWALYLEVCDLINESGENGPRDAIRAIRKRLQLSVGNRNFTVVMYTLTILETCVKNCGRRFHVHVATKEFLKDLVNIMNPKHESPIVVQDKILTLIQCWSIAFQGAPELRAAEQAYQDLKSRGIMFPTTDVEAAVPIITPKRSTHASPTNAAARTSPARMSAPAAAAAAPPPSQQLAMPPAKAPPPPNSIPPGDAHSRHPPPNVQQIVQMSGPVAPTPDQMAKLRSELDIVNGNIMVMGDMLNEMTPGEEDPADLELLHELNRTCRAMQTRLLELIEKISVEEVIEELLHVNDDLNNVFLRFERFERYRTGKTNAASAVENVASESPSATHTASSPQRHNNVEPTPLIDLSSPPVSTNLNIQDADEDVARQLASLGIVDEAPPSNRNIAKPAVVAVSTGNVNVNDSFNVKEDEFKEMEAWLGATGGDNAPTGVTGAISSSEFDDFLASRLNGTDGIAGSAGAAGGGAGNAGGAVGGAAVGGGATESSLIRSIGDVPSISATSGAVPRVNRTSKKDDDQDMLLG